MAFSRKFHCLVAAWTIGVILACLLFAGSVGAATDHPQSEQPPENRSATLTIGHSGSIHADVEYTVWYPARSADEANAASAGTLQTDWFDGRERVASIFDRTAAADASLESGETQVEHVDTRRDASPQSPEYGWVAVTYETRWNHFLVESQPLRIDESVTDPLPQNATLRVYFLRAWETDVLNGDPVAEGGGEGSWFYVWDLSTEPAYPLLVVENPSPPFEEDDGLPVGPAGGFALTILALLVVSVAILRNEYGP